MTISRPIPARISAVGVPLEVDDFVPGAPSEGVVSAPELAVPVLDPAEAELAGAPVLGVGVAATAVASANDPTSVPTGAVPAGSANPQSSRDAPCIHCRRGCWVPCIIVTTRRRPSRPAIPT